MSSKISMGAKNYSAEQVIKNHLNLPARGLGGPNWDAFVHGLAQGEEYLIELAKQAFNQLFISTSEGKYLLKNISNNGFVKPKGLGISEEVLKDLAIKVTSEKLTLHSILEVLEAFYGPEALRSTINSKAGQTFNIKPYSELIIENNKQKILIVFKPENFTDIEFAAPEEISSVINYYLGLSKNNSYAKEVLDPASGLKKIRIYSGDLGLGSYLRILGGEAQNTLQFSTLLDINSGVSTSWLIETVQQNPLIANNLARFTYISGPNPNLIALNEGDYVNAYGQSLDVGNIGTFFITSVGLNYFEVENLQATGQSFTQISEDDLKFFNPTKSTINSNYRVSLAAHANPDALDILYSTTTQIINRTPTTAAYVKESGITGFKDKVKISTNAIVRSGNNVTINSAAHNFQVNDKFYLFPGEQYFPRGVKTVVSANTNSFTYTESLVEGFVSAGTTIEQYLYSNFRTEDGQIVITTAENPQIDQNSTISIQDFVVNNQLNTLVSYQDTTNIFDLVGLQDFGIDRLDENTIIVAGGSNPDGPSKKTYLYNITTNKWSYGPDINTENFWCAGVTLDNGRFLLVGDSGSEIYDPQLNSWIVLPANLTTKDGRFLINKLKDGRVLVAGGTSDSFSEIYDSQLNSWTATQNNLMPPRYSGCLTQLSDGRVLLSGGVDSILQPIETSEIYNPDSNSWTYGGTPIYPKETFNSFLIRNNDGERVIEMGGLNDLDGIINFFDPITNDWTYNNTGYSIPENCASIKLKDKIFFFGGQTSFSYELKVFSYNIINKKYSSFPNLPGGTINSVPFYLGNNKVLLVGTDLGSLLVDFNLVNYYGNINNNYIVVQTTNNQIYLKNGLNHNFSSHPIELTSSSKAISGESPSSSVQGPFIFNPNNSPAITATKTTLTKAILKNQNITTIEVVSTDNFPSEGYLILGFGGNTEKRNIYYNKKDANSFYLTTPTLFVDTYDIGKELIFLKDRSNFNPPNPESVGSFYLTDSSAGRIAADTTIDQIVGTGIKINKQVLYPNAPGVGNWESSNSYKVSDKVYIWGSEEEVDKVRNGLL